MGIEEFALWTIPNLGVKNMAKINKFLALLLCLVMLVGMVPVQAFATGDTTDEGGTVTETDSPETDSEEKTGDLSSLIGQVSGAIGAATGKQTGEVSEEETEEEAEDEPALPAVESGELTASQEDVEITAAETDVVKVENQDNVVTYYGSLQSAFDNVFGTGNYTYEGLYTFTLLGDTTSGTQNIQYPRDGIAVHLIIDLNGHSIRGNGTGSVLNINFGSNTPGTLTIQDSVGGGTISGGNRGIYFIGGASVLNFNGGTITNNHGSEKGGGIFCNTNTAIVNLNGGTISGNSVTGTSSANTGLGGGVCGYNINVNGTIVTGNVANGGTGLYTGRGGGIATSVTGSGTTVNINTNTVYGNTAANAGDDLMIAKNSSSSHTLNIGTVDWYVDGWNGKNQTEGETARYSAGNLVPYITGGATGKFAVGLKYVAPASSTTYTVTYTDGVEDEVVFEDQSYTVGENAATPAFEGTIKRSGYTFDGWDPEPTETVTADATYTATWKVCEHDWKGTYNGETGLVDFVCEICGETKSEDYVAMVKGTGQYYATLQEAVDAGSDDVVVILKNLDIGTAISVKNVVLITADTAVTLTRTGTNDVFDVYADGYLVLEGPVTLVGSNKYGTMVDVMKNGTFVMNAGVTIKGNKTGKSGVGGAVTVTDGQFVMNGGTIDDCANTGTTKPGSSSGGSIGGGVRVVASSGSTSRALFVFNGGSITGCSAYLGGGIGLENKGARVPATVTINGGVISGCSTTGNSANYRGGSAIYIYNKTGNVEDATVTMTAGSITGNTARYNGALCAYTGNMGNTYGGKFYILGGTISGNISGSGDPSSFYGNGIYLDRLIGGKPLLTVGGSAVIADDIYLNSSTGNYFEILDGFTGSVNVYVAAAGTGNNAESYYGTLVAKQVSATGVPSTATKAIARGIVAVYGFKNSEGKVYEHPKYDVVLSTTATDAYVLGEPPTSFTVTYTDGVEDEVVFEDETYTVVPNSATPAFQGSLARKGYVFAGWTPSLSDTVVDDVTYTATWTACEHDWDEGVFDDKTFSWIYTCSICGETKSVAAVARLESTGEYFATLQEAVTTADTYSKTLTGHDKSVSQTVTLLADTTECVKISYTPNSKNLYHYTLTIDLNGHTVTGTGSGSVFTVSRYSSYNYNLTVIFNDSVGTAKVTGGNTTGNGGAIHVDSSKTCYVIINGGTWTGNQAKNGGAVWSSGQTSSPVTINGGVFTGNTATGNGGAFHVRNLTMTAGTVTGNSAASGGGVFAFSGYSQVLNVTGGAIYGNTATTDGDDIIWRANNGSSSTSYMTLPNAGSMAVATIRGWFVDDADNRFNAESPVEFTTYTKYTTQKVRVALKAAMEAAPEAPIRDGSNVMPNLITTLCDSDPDHVSVQSNWSSTNCQIYPTSSVPQWDETLGAWTIGIRIQSLTVQYVMKLENANNDIHHDLVGENTIVTTLKWDKTQSLWVTMDGKPLEVHATCKTKPSAPEFKQLSGYQIQMFGPVNFENLMYAVSLKESTVTVGEVQGNRKDGFTVQVTVALEEDDHYQSTWLSKRAPDKSLSDYTYNWSRTGRSITFTLKYTGDLNGTLYGNRHAANSNYDWVLSTNGKHSGKVGEGYLIPAFPLSPVQSTVVDDFVTVICDSDNDRHGSITRNWNPICCEVIPGTSWSDELNAWTITVKINSLSSYYVRGLEAANNNVIHELVDGATSVYAILRWNVTTRKWVPSEPIVLHTICRTAPVAPGYYQLEAYQIKVKGDVDGDEVYGETTASNDGVGEVYTTSIPEEAYTISEVYGSREEGFFVDITVTLADGDLYQTNWIANCDPAHFYTYDWAKTAKTVTFTLRYNGDLQGTLYGGRHGSNTNYDWVLDTTGNTWGVVGEAYVNQVVHPIQVVIYRNGDTTKPYKVVSLGNAAKGDTLDLSKLDINDYYSNKGGFSFYGWFNDGRWNQYKSGNTVTGLDEIYVNGWTNIICMVKDYQQVVVKAVVNGDKTNAETIYTGTAPMGANLLDWLDTNVKVDDRTGYTLDKWYNWDWYGHKYDAKRTVNGWTNVYVTFTGNSYTITLDPNGGSFPVAYALDPAAATTTTITVTYGMPVGELPVPQREGYTFDGWYDEQGNQVTEDTVYNVQGDMTLTARWVANVYVITLDPNGGTVDPDTIEVTYDDEIDSLPVPTREGFDFEGWVDENDEPVAEGDAYRTAADSTLKAKWSEKETETTKPAETTKPSTPKDPTSPSTGDSTILFFTAVMLLSAAAIWYLLDRQRRMAK